MTSDLSARASSIGRPLDPAFPTNRAVLVMVPLAALGGVFLVDGSPWAGALAGAGSFFLAWALARELAPDHPLAAFGAAGLALLGLLVLPQPSLAIALALLLLTRVVNRSVGPPASFTDTAAALLLVAFAAWSSASPSVLLVAAAAFGFDRRLHPSGPRRHGIVAGACGVIGIAGALTIVIGTAGGGPARLVAVASVLAIGAFSVGILRTRRVATGADLDGVPLSPARVRAAMTLAPALLVTSWIPGGPALESLGIVTATMLALALPLLLARRHSRA